MKLREYRASEPAPSSAMSLSAAPVIAEDIGALAGCIRSRAALYILSEVEPRNSR